MVSGAFTSRAQIILDLLAQSGLRDILLYLVCIGTIIFKMSATSMNLLDVENDVAAQVFSDPVYKRKLLFNKFQLVLETSKPETVCSLLPLLENPEEPEHDVENNIQAESSNLTVPDMHHKGWFSFFFQSKAAPPDSNKHAVGQIKSAVYSRL